MKKLLIGFLLLASVMSFAIGQKETVSTEVKPVTLLFAVDASNFGASMWGDMARRFEAENENVKVKWIGIDVSTGGNESMMAYTAAGVHPMFKDYTGRIGQFTNPDYALDLTPYILDKDKYVDGVFAPYTRDGKIYGIPFGGTPLGFWVNKTLLNEAGYTIPPNWTVADFVKMCDAVKTKTGKYPVYIFSKNQNADYLYMLFFTFFGAEMYAPGDNTKSALNSPAGLKGMEFLKLMYDKGWTPKEAAALDANDYLRETRQNAVAAGFAMLGWMSDGMNSMISQGSISERFEYEFVTIPKEPGVTRGGMFLMQHGVVAPRSDYVDYWTGERKPKNQRVDDMYGKLAIAVRDTEEGEYRQNSVSVRSNITFKPLEKADTTPDWVFALTVRDTNTVMAQFPSEGIWDMGLALPEYSTIRPLFYPRMQAMFAGKETPAEALAKYEADVNKVLRGE